MEEEVRLQQEPSVLLRGVAGVKSQLLAVSEMGDGKIFWDILVRLWTTPYQRMPSGWLNKDGGRAENQVDEN